MAENKNKKKKKKRKHGSWLLFRVIVLAVLILVVAGGGIAGTFVYGVVKAAPTITKEKLADPLSSKFYDRNGQFLHEYGNQQRTKITYSQIPPVLEHAFIATEDSRFYSHHGVDIKRTAKAILANLTGGYGSQGGSTITQQVIKNSILTPEKTVKRKIQEWYLAYQLEKQYSKKEILTMYLNKINLGNRSYGVAAAAKNYYGLDVGHLDKMTLPQAAMIAGLTQSPNAYDPSKKDHIDAATKRRNIVLKLMNMHGYITKSEMQAAQEVPVTQGLVQEKPQSGMPYQAFLDAAVNEVEAKLKNVDITKDGLKIYLTLDQKAQQRADSIISGRLVQYPNSRFQTAFTFMDAKTGAIRAIGSGRNQYKTTFRGRNLVTALKRQPGSTFKPIFDYGPAIEYLNWSTYHQLVDEPYEYSTGDPIRNAVKNYKGKMSIRNALIESRNIPALKTLQEVGTSKAQKFSESLGISYPNNRVYESYAIGSNPVSPVQMAGAYGAFANKGVYNQPHFVSKVVLANGKEISFESKPKRVMHDYTAYMVTDILRGVLNAPNGTGTVAKIPGADIAGKTGTTNFDDSVIRKWGYPEDATSDSWFAGYSTNYVTVVWTGYPANGYGNYMGRAETKVSHTIFKEMMLPYSYNGTFTQPSSVLKIRNELYIKGAAPDVIPPDPKAKKKEAAKKAPDKKEKDKKPEDKKTPPPKEKNGKPDEKKPNNNNPGKDPKDKGKEMKKQEGKKDTNVQNKNENGHGE
ncbi:transglycosylase domain-containing protein [Peribacillus kribbensis]|uniref:transglycosylase domain-containing protein n=1 Tax=Peribacillus kribbensis TaxID=356658 RepID=UPI001FDEADA6|nr:PBP1A family penicillin-binding protein [Peribacillus kribbensis]